MKKHEEKHACPCCFNTTLDGYGHFDICDICGWEDDLQQRDDINYRGGANKMSLREARNYWKITGKRIP